MQPISNMVHFLDDRKPREGSPIMGWTLSQAVVGLPQTPNLLEKSKLGDLRPQTGPDLPPQSNRVINIELE